MNFWKKIFPSQKSKSITTFEVENIWGLGNGTPLIVEVEPDLEKIFNDLDISSLQKQTDKNTVYWKNESIEQKRLAFALAYLNHPNIFIGMDTIKYIRSIKNNYLITEALARLLTAQLPILKDYIPTIQSAAAHLIWENEIVNNCLTTVQILNDMLKYGDRNHFWDENKVTTALDVLLKFAPNEVARKELDSLIGKSVIIENRIKDVDMTSVRFVGYEKKRDRTYEVYQAKTKTQALSFLKRKKVDKDLYYIEVETQEGNFGRDINGIYEV